MPRIPKSARLALAAAILLAPANSLAVDTNANLAYFEKHVRPLLAGQCYRCHAEGEDRTIEGDLRLDTRAGWLAGGASGKPALVPGKPDASPLLDVLAAANPTEGHDLTEAQVTVLTRWVRMGAPDPRSGDTTNRKAIDIDAGRDFWSFQRIQEPEPPAVKNTAWPRNDIDRFILARLEAEGLEPAPDAPGTTVARRLHTDLTGLPPSYNGTGATVDDLLASPHFGERWARHWLDIARFAESSGGGRAHIFHHAWRYRDFVVRSFNDNKPFDHFVRQQLAGDLLPHGSPEERADNLTATAFLAIGPTNYELQDKDLLDMDVIDEQLDTLSQGLLGMTVGCARCHDHKFDPIPAHDYYALAGIFKSTKALNHANVSQYLTTPLPLGSEEAEHRQAQLEVAHKKKTQALQKNIKDTEAALKRLGAKPAANTAGKGGTDPATLPGIVVDDSAAVAVGSWKPSTFSGRWVGAGYRHDDGQPKGANTFTFTADLTDPGEHEVRVAYSANSNRSPDAAFTVHHTGGTTTVKIDQRKQPPVDGLFASLGKFTFPANAPAKVVVSNKDTSGVVIADAVQFLPPGTADTKPEKNPEKKSDPGAGRLASQRSGLEHTLSELREQLKAHQKDAPPARPKTMTVSDMPEPADTTLRLRGLVHNHGPVVPRGFIQVASRPGAAVPSIPDGQSGRLQLAEWITAPHNPLTARVLANRVWRHLLGEGLVRTPDNFGATGETPSHPELLDYLAHRLVHTHGWSVKALVRDIVSSRTYRLASTPSDAARASDPDNRLLSHAHRRRLDAEVIRDTVLAVSGQLDPAVGGPTIRGGTRSEFGYEFGSRRRSLYLPVFRNNLPDLFTVFDFADPNIPVGDRNASAVPTQALYMMNSPFVLDQATHAANQLLEATGQSTDADRVTRAYTAALNRPPTDKELELALAFIRSERAAGRSETGAYTTFHHALFASLDFRYLD